MEINQNTLTQFTQNLTPAQLSLLIELTVEFDSQISEYCEKTGKSEILSQIYNLMDS
jgi:hypothetical protein